MAGFLPIAHSAVPAPPLTAWLSESHLPPAVQNAFRARFTADPQAREWLVTQDGQVYALAYQPFSPTTHPQIQQAIRGTVEMKARHLLMLYATGEYYQRQGFSSREAIAKALTAVDATTQGQLLPGLQSRATVLDQAAVALVWTEENRIASYRQQPPSIEQFRPAYCRALYPTAKALFQEQKYRQALAIYQDMHVLHCHQPTAYFLDAAECFLALQQPQDARRMANYLLTEYLSSLGSSEVERAGDVLFKAGDEENARKAYERALSKLREEN
ncbi:MAG: hypothetical protein P9F75_10655 [Candidatus Contendobacter sp.]|nr:hypothetical protein [Candidatus Contendobacter sp.]